MLLKRIRNYISKLFMNRITTMSAIFVIIFALLIARVFTLQIIKGSSYQENFTLKIQKTKEISATRGNIYDRNGELLAYNDLAYSVTIEDDGTYDEDTYEDRNEALNTTIENVIMIVETNGDTIQNDFGIQVDEDGKYAFTATTKTEKLRFLADVYGYADTDDLSKKERSSSAKEVMAYLMGDDRYMLTNVKDKEMCVKIINIRYLMTQKSYTKYMATTIATDVSQKTVAQINECKADYPGIDVIEDSVRRYTDAECFSSVIGYTGTISQDEYDALDDSVKDQYSLQSTIGKAGIEQYLDSDLQGTPGEETLFVDSVGKVLLTTDVTDPKAGNDVYLTIDKTMQEQAYKILEEQIAGIVLKNLTPTLTYEKPAGADTMSIKIPIGDVYGAFFENGILNVNNISRADDDTVQSKAYAKVLIKEKEAIDQVITELKNPTSARKDYNDETEDYVSYFLKTFLVSSGLLNDDNIDYTANEYIAWSQDQSTTLRDYVTFLISENAIDTDELGVKSIFTDTDEVISALCKYANENMYDTYTLSILCYKYMCSSGTLTGNEVCAMAIEQGVFSDDGSYDAFASGTGDPYGYLYNKIYNLELTPGELGLEPCSGSIMITDPKTGDVLACVSYPGYDSNRLSNTMDKQYYQQLSLSASKPLYNHATQEKTAPGSTYKMVTALAGLETGCITTESVLPCSGEFEYVTPSPKCWIYPKAHGSENVITALRDSCNCFFYNVGYGLSQEDTSNYPLGMKGLQRDEDGNLIEEEVDEADVNKYSNLIGLKKLKQYASKFGLNKVSGLELNESKPEISDTDSVRSAIGQGTNLYTLSQLSVYVTAIANRGTVYDYSLIDRVETTRGKVVKEYGSQVRSTIDTKTEYWDAIQEGMHQMILNTAGFYTNGFTNASGKTGTAQISKKHADTGLFVGYTPYDNPKITVAVRITNGYSSYYPAQVASKIMRLYNGVITADEAITNTATAAGNAARAD